MEPFEPVILEAVGYAGFADGQRFAAYRFSCRRLADYFAPGITGTRIVGQTFRTLRKKWPIMPYDRYFIGVGSTVDFYL